MLYISLIVCLIKLLQRLLEASAQQWKIGASVFHMVVRWHKLGEMKNECILHNSIVLAIFVPKIIKVGKNLTKLWKKQFWLLLWKHGVQQAF